VRGKTHNAMCQCDTVMFEKQVCCITAYLNLHSNMIFKDVRHW